MKYVRPRSLESAARFTAKKISDYLTKEQKVLWLLSGGTSIALTVEVAKLLKGSANLENLTVTLADERYGPKGYKDSNWEQIKQAGFDLPGANLQAVLKGKSLDETAKDYAQMLEEDLSNCDYSLIIAGVGADGHTFGVKPDSPALDAQELVCGYEWDDFDRLTITPKFIKRASEIIVFSLGPEKRQQLEMLEQDLPISKQPAQTLKQVKDLTILNAFKGDEI